MPSTATYMDVVNSTLSSIGQDELTATNFTSAKRDQRRVKRIVSETVADMARLLPDNHWQTTFGLVVRPPIETGTVTAVSDKTVTLSGVSFSTAPESLYRWADYSCWFNLKAEDQWYQVLSAVATTVTLHEYHTSYSPTEGGTALAGASDPYRIVQLRWPLPADFSDVMDVHKVFDDVDVEPVGVNDIVRSMRAAGGMITAKDPTKYAIGWDLSDRTGSRVSLTVPQIYLWPPVTNTTVYNLIYKRTPINLDWDTSANTTKIDLPEDLIAQLKHRCKMLAAVEISQNTGQFQVHGQLEDEQKRQSALATMSRAEGGRIVPRTASYREFYRRGPDNNRLWESR